MSFPQRLPRLFVLLVLISASLTPITASATGFVSDVVDRLRDSEIEFQRRGSNAPFSPLGYLGGRYYSEARLTDERDDRTLDFQQTNASAYGGLPAWIGQRDAVFAGGWLSRSRFSADDPLVDDFSVDSVGIGAGWLRQLRPQWQAAAFVLPIWHRSSVADSDWRVQTMGGAFARYIQHENLWWAFGVFANSAIDESYVLPYAGASWLINERWTLSAILPWPAILYAPNRDWLFRLGASPSGASWAISPGNDEVAINLSGWNFGVTAERHLTGYLWLAAEGGIGGLRGVRLNRRSGSLDSPDINVGSNGYVGLSLRLRVR